MKKILFTGAIIFSLLLEISPAFAQTVLYDSGGSTYGTYNNPYGSSYGSASGSAYGSLTVPPTGLPQNPSGVLGVMNNVLLWLLAAVGILSVIAFVIAGIQFLTSVGNEKDAEKAKHNVTYAIIGIVVALSGLIILTTINMILGGANPASGGSAMMGF